MIRINLPVLLAKRRMKITDLHKRTGISRTTLAALYYEKAKGVQFETLSKICKELDCTINDLIEIEDVA